MKQYKVEDLLTYEIDNMLGDDYPDFCDAHISKAVAKNGSELAEDELEWLNDNDHEGVGTAVQNNVANWLSRAIDDAMNQAEEEEYRNTDLPWVGM